MKLELPVLPALISFLILCGCNPQDDSPPRTIQPDNFINAVDISGYPEMEGAGVTFYDREGNTYTLLSILKKAGINTIRLRLWVNPEKPYSGFESVQKFSTQLKGMGFKIWITVHYSDTWADPGKQEVPQAWRYLTFEGLQNQVLDYTRQIAKEIKPDIIQIGNEINSGLLHPFGHITQNPEQFKRLLNIAIGAVRSQSPESQIMLHYAGISGADRFYSQVQELDFDLIGLSYYPMWHGKSLSQVKNTLKTLSDTYEKSVLIAETAYPFTLDWSDWTNNIVGLESQLILPEYPATREGQLRFLSDLKATIQEVNGGIGLCYWAPEWIAWKGPQAPDGSPWENQALFDFEGKALPALSVFETD
jgi:arabinogalactan endo-1,4-beta-galactosidase